MISRRQGLQLLAIGAVAHALRIPAFACDGLNLLMLNGCDPVGVRQLADAGNEAVRAEVERLRKDADTWLTKGPWSVTGARPKDTPSGKNDFFSEGPYWWPDPANPGGPYIRRDGEVNPERFTRNDNDLKQLCDAVLCLATAAAILEEEKYAQHAWNLIRVWFVDPETRMNPNLEFGQAIRGVVWGRGIGLIDTTPMISLVQGLMFLELGASKAPDLAAEMHVWMREFVRWMTKSEKGVDERDNGNNHTTWWAAQVAAYSTYLKDEASLLAAWKVFYEQIVPKQLMPDGSQPKEEARTRSLSYSAMNLDGIAILCRIGQFWGMELWDYEGPAGSSVAKSIDYLAPFLKDPAKWRKPQITPFDARRTLFPALAGWGLNKPEYLGLQRQLGCEGRELSRWVRMLLALSPSA